MNTITSALRDIFFPACCLACNAQLATSRLPHLCPQCLSETAPLTPPLCTCCGTPFCSGADHLCGVCLRDGFAFDRCRSLFPYQEPIVSLLLQLKFNAKLTGLATLGRLTQLAGVYDLFQEPDFILPVPLHINRLRSRGFNQSQLLSRACFPQWREKIKVDLLLRHRSTVPQTSLSGKARKTNLKQAFTVPGPDAIQGKTILLVDDVFTTGSTLHECASVLRRAGAEDIQGFTLARAI